jgi:hypothetical protein
VYQCIRSARAVDHVIITPVCVSSVENNEGTLRQIDIYLLRQKNSELYNITRLINGTYVIPILPTTFWMLTGVLCSLYEVLVDFKIVRVADALYVCHYLFGALLQSKIILSHSFERSKVFKDFSAEIAFRKNCINECVKELNMFSLQLQVMGNEFTVCGFFSLNLNIFASVVSVIVSYVIIMVQIKEMKCSNS